MTTIWISEFNWHRLRKASRNPKMWASKKRTRRRKGIIMVELDIDDKILARLQRLDSNPNKAITIAFDGFTTTQHP